MGFACPVCSDPQADGGHLANHLAFTAMLGDEAHEAWLEEYAPGWAETGEAELADVVVDHVEETEFPQVFEDTAGGLDDDAEPPAERSGALFDDDHGDGPAHDHAHRAPTGSDPAHDRGGEDARMDEAAEAILEEAREMTRGRLEGDAEDDGGGTSAESGGASGAADDGGGTSAEGGDADDDGGGSGRRG
jgi:hypothetical protein